jgi:hypothetical protein
VLVSIDGVVARRIGRRWGALRVSKMLLPDA